MTEQPILVDDYGPLYHTPAEARALVAGSDWYPLATRQSWGVDGGSILAGYRPRVTLHTTEGTGWPDYSKGGTLPPGATAPHNTVGLFSGRIQWRQHIPYSRAARALRNPSGGVETNRTGTIQVEIIWYAGRAGDLPAQLYDALAEWARWLEANRGVPQTTMVRFTATSAATAPRLSGPAWDALAGWHGHEHVPENDHWDPGSIDVGRILRADQAKEWFMADIPVENLNQIEGAAVDAIAGPDGQTAIRRAVAAELTAALDKIGANQLFVQQPRTPQVYVVLSGRLFHIPDQATLYAIGGANAISKIIQVSADDGIWSEMPITGQQPGV